jgi:hypothetical protein
LQRQFLFIRQYRFLKNLDRPLIDAVATVG